MTMAESPQITSTERACLRRLQALEDAIAYRSARLAEPCPDCGPVRCDDHATDANLITVYWRDALTLDATLTALIEPQSNDHVRTGRAKAGAPSFPSRLCDPRLAHGATEPPNGVGSPTRPGESASSIASADVVPQVDPLFRMT
jgi:hypothetical protein